MEELFLALGSNLGDRELNLKTAVSMLNESLGLPLAQSSVIQTEACGFSGPDFLNTIVKYNCVQTATDVLKICKRIEREMGRNDELEFDKNGNRIYHDRIIDIDILSYGNVRLNTPELTLPHPQIKTRPYILPLLMEIEGK